MPKDYAKRSSRPAAKKKTAKPRANTRKKPVNAKAPLWAWIVMAGALITLLIYLANQSADKQVAVQNEKPAVIQESKEPQPRFDF